MPKYVFHNPTFTKVHIPRTGRWVKPRSNLVVDIQAVVFDTPEMQILLESGALRLSPVVETPKIYDGIEIPVVEMLGTGGGGGAIGWDRTGIELLATGNPRVFTTPEKFVHVPGGLSIEIFHQGGGRRLQLSTTGNPSDGDYTLSESGGLGTGYDTITVISLTPKGLEANYRTI